MDAVLRLFRQTAVPGRIVVVATHDERLVPIADRVVELSAPRLTERGIERVELAPGEVLFYEGEPGDVAYVVESGHVELIRRLSDGGEEVVLEAGPDTWFGELAPLFGLPRSATARATTATVVTSCTPQDLRKRVKAHGLDGRSRRLVLIALREAVGPPAGQGQQSGEDRDGHQHHQHLVPSALVGEHGQLTCRRARTSSVVWLSTSKSPAWSAVNSMVASTPAAAGTSMSYPCRWYS